MYRVEVVIPLETGFPTLRTSTFTSDSNDELLKKSLDLIEERRENVMVQLAYYQHKLKQSYDTNVKLRPLAPGDLVLRKVLENTKNPAWGKLGPNWEGPYRITSVARIGAYCWKNRCAQRKKNGSTSLENDNMCYVSFKIREQECVPWCGEIQNQRSEVRFHLMPKMCGLLISFQGENEKCPTLT